MTGWSAIVLFMCLAITKLRKKKFKHVHWIDHINVTSLTFSIFGVPNTK